MNIFFVFLFFGACAAKFDIIGDPGPGYDCGKCQPEQVHINFGEKLNDIVVTWSTFDDPKESRVQYGVGEMNLEAVGNRTKFVDGGIKRRSQIIHRATMKDLKFNTSYVYHVGSEYGWSDKFSFKTPPQGEDWVVRAAIYGDMGNTNAHSLSYLQDEAERGHFDLILHVGDFAYDMHEDNGRTGDKFMRQIEPLAATVPYMVCPGNHEQNYNFSHYRNRFSMPGNTESLFYSFDIGPIHFVSISTEVYYYLGYGAKVLVNQFDWLEKDLTEANLPENRNKRPWIILYGHRPMYCSNSDDPDCSAEYTRKGAPLWGFPLEPVLKKFGVDIVIWAHEHSYERTWPLYDLKVYNGSYEQPYVNPKAPVHIVTGSAGCRERTDPFKKKPYEWTAFCSTDYGYTRFKAQNKTHIYMEQEESERKISKQASYRGLILIIPVFSRDYDLEINLKTTTNYIHFRAPVHIVTGSAGCKEGRDHFKRKPFKWSAFRAQDFGYTKFKAYNKTHIHMEQISIDLGGRAIDQFWIVQDNHGHFNLTSL